MPAAAQAANESDDVRLLDRRHEWRDLRRSYQVHRDGGLRDLLRERALLCFERFEVSFALGDLVLDSREVGDIAGVLEQLDEVWPGCPAPLLRAS